MDGAPAFTRLGALSADGGGNITLGGGRLLDPPVTLAPGMTLPAVDQSGVISALNTEGVRETIGQITMVRFVNPQGLELMGSGLYKESVNSGELTEGTPGSPGFAGVSPAALGVLT